MSLDFSTIIINNYVKWWKLTTTYLEHLNTIVYPVTHIKKPITIKQNATWTTEFTSSLPVLAKGSEECARQLEYSNTMVFTHVV